LYLVEIYQAPDLEERVVRLRRYRTIEFRRRLLAAVTFLMDYSKGRSGGLADR
jgi:hypothetical protein